MELNQALQRWKTQLAAINTSALAARQARDALTFASDKGLTPPVCSRQAAAGFDCALKENPN